LELRLTKALTALVAGLALWLAVVQPAAAKRPPPTPSQSNAAPGALVPHASTEATPPKGYLRSPRRILAVADRDPKVRRTKRAHPDLLPQVNTKGPGRWQVSYFSGRHELVQVILADATGRVLESWTGAQVAWLMARGYPGAFGHKVNAPYVWLPLCAVFLLAFFDWRRPLRLAHLDLMMLLAFGVSHIYFNRAEIGVSVPLVYPCLVYLLARMCWLGFRRGRSDPLRPAVPAAWLAIGLLFLIGFRVGLNVADSNVIDVGYSGVIGADRIAHGRPIYGNFPRDDQSGDTYGPAAYYAYVPFERVWPWNGKWGSLPAAHAAAIFFDLLTLLGLWLVGRRLRPGQAGSDLGVALAFAWAACPYTAFVLCSNANDSLVAAAVVFAFLAMGRPMVRGALAAIAGATKFAPLALAGLLGRVGGGRRLALYLLAFGATAGLLMAQTLIDPGIAKFYERTISFQAGRDSPFSIWGQVDGLDWLQTIVKVGAVGLAAAIAFLPRRLTPSRAAALGAAALIALELTLEHWFYLYIVWFLPMVLIALTASGTTEQEPSPA
jgi:hypothetical protein